MLALALCLVSLGLGLARPLAAQEATPPAPELPPPLWVSPTPDENGVISVVVQPGESLWVIAARAGLALPDLLALNNLSDTAVISPGDVIIIGTGTPPPTAVSPEQMTPSATPPPPTLRPTHPPPAAAVCLTAFEDTNQNGLQDSGETATPGVAFTVYNREVVVGNIITDGRPEPHCLLGLTPGEYYVTRSLLPGEILTTDGDWALVIADDSTLFQAFGSVRAAATPASPATSGAPAVAEASSPVASPEVTTAPPAGSNPDDDVLLWGGAALLFVGGLLLLSAVLILLYRRTRSES